MEHPDVIMYPSPIVYSRKLSTSAKGNKIVNSINKIRITTKFNKPRKKTKILPKKNSAMKVTVSQLPIIQSTKTTHQCLIILLKLKNFPKWILLLSSAKLKTNRI